VARISMDGKGRWVDNVFVELLWRSLKYLTAYASIAQANRGIGVYFDFYNHIRPHQSLPERMTPEEAYFGMPPMKAAA
jgi:putative transposase